VAALAALALASGRERELAVEVLVRIVPAQEEILELQARQVLRLEPEEIRLA
jgi:hypothetical protein